MEYLIGDFSRISRLGIKTLRHYHEIGLLVPVRVDPLSGYRYYDEGSLQRARAIIRLRQLDFDLAAIAELLKDASTEQEFLAIMEEQFTEMDQKIRQYQAIRDRLAAYICSESDTVVRSGEVSEREILEIQVASLRFRGRYPDIAEKIDLLFQICQNNINGSPFCLYYDDKSMEEDADIEVCMPVRQPVSGEGIQNRWLSGGRAISVVHQGPHEQIWKTYRMIVDYLNEHQLEPIFPSREVYLKGFGTVFPIDPGQYLTEIQFLLT